MINHIVLLKLKSGTTKDHLKEMFDNLKFLKNIIPGIKSFSSGENVSPEDRKLGFTYGFIMTFEDEKSRDEYLVHPEHKKIGEKYILPIAEEILVFDYEV